MQRWSVLFAIALAATACGSSSAVSSEGAGPATVVCGSDPDEVVELLREGLPTYDYNPATDLSNLIDRVDLVLSGTLLAAERVENPGDFEASTRIEVAEAQVLVTNDPELDVLRRSGARYRGDLGGARYAGPAGRTGRVRLAPNPLRGVPPQRHRR